MSRAQCSYCHKTYRLGSEPPSHGICPPCLKQQRDNLDQIRDWLALSRAYEESKKGDLK